MQPKDGLRMLVGVFAGQSAKCEEGCVQIIFWSSSGITLRVRVERTLHFPDTVDSLDWNNDLAFPARGSLEDDEGK